MSQIKLAALLLSLLLSMLFLVLTGCGNPNSQANFSSDTGTHPAGWLPDGHAVAATNQIATATFNCTDCHGNDLLGGISKVSCFTPANSGSTSTSTSGCHLGNDLQVHPLQWGQYAYALHGTYVQLQDPTAASCANVSCHGASLTGVSGSGPSCTSCHLGGSAFSVHPTGWNTAADLATPTPPGPLHAQYVGANGTTACSNTVCHGTNLQGVFLSGPSCNTCHAF
jgi:hypothetical protein